MFATLNFKFQKITLYNCMKMQAKPSASLGLPIGSTTWISVKNNWENMKRCVYIFNLHKHSTVWTIILWAYCKNIILYHLYQSLYPSLASSSLTPSSFQRLQESSSLICSDSVKKCLFSVIVVLVHFRLLFYLWSVQ